MHDIMPSRGDGIMKSSEAQKKASNKYNKENTWLLGIRLNKRTEADIIEYIDKRCTIDGKRHLKSYIMSLIQKDMEENA